MKALKLVMMHLAALALLTAASAQVQAEQWSATVDGVTAYFGIVPAALARGGPAPHGAPSGDALEYHFIVALYDAASGQRIEQAQVSAHHQPPIGGALHLYLSPGLGEQPMSAPATGWAG